MTHSFQALLLSLLFLSTTLFSSSIDLSDTVRNVGVDPQSSALCIICIEDGTKWISGAHRQETQYPPASTSKIPHTLIALEENFVDGPETLFEWDQTKRFLDVWNQDQTMRSAFQNSVLWVYQRITSRLGHQTMAKWMKELQYGNCSIGTPQSITTYWLEGPLTTSISDQVQFLSRFIKEELPLKQKTYQLGREIFEGGRGDDWVLFAKTGFSAGIGWYVGWVETITQGKRNHYVFAFNMDLSDWNNLHLRQTVVFEAFREIGLDLCS